MKKLIIITLIVLAVCPMQAAKTAVSQLTLEEKIGQMMQLVTDLFGTNDAQGVFHIDRAKADTLFGKYKIGSILNVPNSYAPTATQWEEIISDIQKLSMKHIGIPCIFGLDQNHGSTYTQGGTLFPQNINVAATFNRDIAFKSAEATAYETRAVSVPWTFSPTIDLGRDARWPRIWENFGEDCYVNAEMARMETLGFQGSDPQHIDQQHIAVSLKHYLGYGVPWSGKDRTPAYISPSDLREKHFAPFLAAIREGAASVMVNSASVNGMPVHANHELLTVWLKEQTGWDGVVITDWADINNLYTRERVAKDKKEALCIAINAGIDMIMEPYSVEPCQLLKELVEEGKIPMSRIDDAVSRILRMKERLGLYKHPTQRLKDYPMFGGKEFAQIALDGAVESMILLKNEGNILPLAKEKTVNGTSSNRRFLVTGPNANQMRCLNGGWSYTWQGLSLAATTSPVGCRSPIPVKSIRSPTTTSRRARRRERWRVPTTTTPASPSSGASATVLATPPSNTATYRSVCLAVLPPSPASPRTTCSPSASMSPIPACVLARRACCSSAATSSPRWCPTDAVCASSRR